MLGEGIGGDELRTFHRESDFLVLLHALDLDRLEILPFVEVGDHALGVGYGVQTVEIGFQGTGDDTSLVHLAGHSLGQIAACGVESGDGGVDHPGDKGGIHPLLSDMGGVGEDGDPLHDVFLPPQFPVLVGPQVSHEDEVVLREGDADRHVVHVDLVHLVECRMGLVERRVRHVDGPFRLLPESVKGGPDECDQFAGLGYLEADVSELFGQGVLERGEAFERLALGGAVPMFREVEDQCPLFRRFVLPGRVLLQSESLRQVLRISAVSIPNLHSLPHLFRVFQQKRRKRLCSRWFRIYKEVPFR